MRSPTPTKKFGVYADDAAVFDWLRDGAAAGERCIEADVMDWADDVAYSVHDVEDAIASRSIDPRLLHSRDDVAVAFTWPATAYAPDLADDDFAAALDRLLATGMMPQGYDGSRRDLAALKDMTSRLVGRFVLAVEDATRGSYGPGPLTPLRRPAGRPRRGARGDLGAQGGGQPLRHVRRRAARGDAAPARGGRRPGGRASGPTRPASTPTCAPTTRPPTARRPRCGSSSTRWPRSPTDGPSTLARVRVLSPRRSAAHTVCA